MRNYNFHLLTWGAWLLLAMPPAANAQSVTGQLSGSVTDSTGAAIAGASVHLIQDVSQDGSNIRRDQRVIHFHRLGPGHLYSENLYAGLQDL